MSENIFRAINTDNIETMCVFKKALVENWQYTDSLEWKKFFSKKTSIKVELKWYDIKDFKYNKIFSSNKQEAIKNTKQFYTDEDLINYLNPEEYIINHKYMILNKKVYIKPHIRITFISGQKQYIYFDSTTKAIEYVGELKRQMDKKTLIFC